MMYEMVKGLSKITTSSEQIIPSIIMLKFTNINAYMVGDNSGWVLVDTGLENSYDYILKTTMEHFGKGSRPKAIILTHGHFDHVGSVTKLAEYWDVQVYASELELPYLNLGERVLALAGEGQVPGMPGWEWLPTPGHTPGHISLFQENNKILIVGDAFTTTKQEALLSVINGRNDIKGPPAYLTTDWRTSRKSLDLLKSLRPTTVLPSHGAVLTGDALKNYLDILQDYFDQQAVPEEGKYL